MQHPPVSPPARAQVSTRSTNARTTRTWTATRSSRGKVGLVIGNHVLTRNLGRVFAAETGFLLQRGPDTVRAPDAAFVAGGRLAAGEVPAGFLEMAPDLAVEVVSPGDSAAAVRAKVDDWRRAGTRLVWVMYPETRSVTAHRPARPPTAVREPGALDGAPVFPDFKVPVRDFFT